MPWTRASASRASRSSRDGDGTGAGAAATLRETLAAVDRAVSRACADARDAERMVRLVDAVAVARAAAGVRDLRRAGGGGGDEGDETTRTRRSEASRASRRARVVGGGAMEGAVMSGVRNEAMGATERCGAMFDEAGETRLRALRRLVDAWHDDVAERLSRLSSRRADASLG